MRAFLQREVSVREERAALQDKIHDLCVAELMATAASLCSNASRLFSQVCSDCNKWFTS